MADVHLPLPIPGADRARAEATAIAAQLDDYVLPRLARLDAPLLVVVGGSTGAGKSTLVNSLVGRPVTSSGVIRPTTRHPVLVHNTEDAGWFTGQRILPGLARTTGEAGGGKALRLVAEPTLPRGLAILDAPDIDSVVDENRTLAGQLLAAADMWLFVTSAARYADAVPWDFLNGAAQRHVVVGVVLDRVPPAAMRDIPGHLGQMMAHRGLGSAPLFAVPETSVDAQGILPNAAVSPIRGWLAGLVANEQTRQQVVRATLSGAIDDTVRRAPAIATAVDEQVGAVTQLRDDANRAYDQAVKAVKLRTADGTLLRGEVLARWHEFVGTGEFMRAVENRISLLRDRLMAVFRGQRVEADHVKVAVESGLEALIIEEGRAAAERAEAAWRGDPAGRHVLESATVDLATPAHDFDDQVARMIREWQGAVFGMVSEESGPRRLTARYLALGVNGVAATLMVLIFSQTGGLTGAEVGIAGGSVALAQSLLEAVFGDENVRRMAKKAKDDLDERVEVLMSSALLRYHQTLVALQVRPQQSDEIRAAVRAVEAEAAGGLLPGMPVTAGGELPAAAGGELPAVPAGGPSTGTADEPAAMAGGTPTVDPPAGASDTARIPTGDTPALTAGDDPVRPADPAGLLRPEADWWRDHTEAAHLDQEK
ncbi:hypothetical protein SDC9_88812 [bioreactor metagenome]|uniref:Dynamin N-terminal domain-containing protein n=1 Tax=bioreactor metagenome TaxID=1076179 RepID=A0A644ZMJ6_9ZZZZ